jgi:hypothetical protein
MRVFSGALGIAASLVASFAHAQSAADRSAVLGTVQRLFDGMRTRDSALIASALDSSGVIESVNDSAPPSVRVTPVTVFVARFAHRADTVTERIFAPDVRLDGPVAQVWAYFTVHVGQTFLQCGTDAFTLAKTRDAWKITHTAFSRRTRGCTHTEPPSK